MCSSIEESTIKHPRVLTMVYPKKSMKNKRIRTEVPGEVTPLGVAYDLVGAIYYKDQHYHCQVSLGPTSSVIHDAMNPESIKFSDEFDSAYGVYIVDTVVYVRRADT